MANTNNAKWTLPTQEQLSQYGEGYYLGVDHFFKFRENTRLKVYYITITAVNERMVVDYEYEACGKPAKDLLKYLQTRTFMQIAKHFDRMCVWCGHVDRG